MGGVTKVFNKALNWGARLNERAGVNWLENKIAGKGTENTFASQVLDPFRKARANSAAGATTQLGDVFDPNAKLHKAATNTDENVQAQDAANAEAARLAVTPPSLTSANISARQQADRLRRRQGVLANIYGGSSGTLSVGVKQLLGQ